MEGGPQHEWLLRGNADEDQIATSPLETAALGHSLLGPDRVMAPYINEGGASTATPGTGPTGGSAGAAAPGASVSVDWRFYKNWLIRATVGTSADVPKGEVDLLWQYRY